MEKFFLSILSCALSATITVSAQSSGPLVVHQYELSNGMQVWLNEDHSQPVVHGAVVVKAGGRDCTGTGMAHYLEHMLFKGTEDIGTIDYASEKVYLDSIETCYDLIAATSSSVKRDSLQKEINRLSIKALDYAIPNEFDRLTANIGGTKLNAFTSYDCTCYHNSFSPQFIAQWAELNSHRLLNPVFRLFQSELEAVYEEKNAAADSQFDMILEKMLEKLGDENPYSKSIIGTTDNLKNPSLSEMKKFFNKYYVGCNMGLILAGDIDASSILPLLESTFGRIPRGDKPERIPVPVPDFSSREDYPIKVNFPMIKASLNVFNGPAAKDADYPAMELALSLLNNSFSTGSLDSLINNGKVLAGEVSVLDFFDEMGLIAMITIPGIPFGSLKKAEARCFKEVGRLKAGDFAEKDFESLKYDIVKSYKRCLETSESRFSIMIDVMSQDRSWDSYLSQVESVSSLTSEDIVRVSNKYLGDNRIRFHKVRGTYPKDNLQAPSYETLSPKNGNAVSDYATRLMEMPYDTLPPRLVDMNNDIRKVAVNDHVTLYYNGNPVNDVFELTVRINKGIFEEPMICPLTQLLGLSGTDSLSAHDFSMSLAELGSDLSFKDKNHTLEMVLTGFDDRIGPSLDLLRHFMKDFKPEKGALNTVISDTKMSRNAFRSSGNSAIFNGMFNYSLLGNQSPLLRQPTEKDLKSLGLKGMKELFNSLVEYDFDVVYSGGLSPEEVVNEISGHLDVECPSGKPESSFFAYRKYEQPVVYIYNVPGARQVMSITYQNVATPENDHDSALLDLMQECYGGSMASIMFQEVREFRSLAYTSSSTLQKPLPNVSSPSAFITYYGTQADKFPQALELVDSLIRTMPMTELCFDSAVRSIISRANNGYPSFRALPEYVANLELFGYGEDDDASVVRGLPGITKQDVLDYHEKSIGNAPCSYFIIGDKKNLPMDALRERGRIVELKLSDIYR